MSWSPGRLYSEHGVSFSGDRSSTVVSKTPSGQTRRGQDYGTICAVPLMTVVGRLVHWALKGQEIKCHECYFTSYFLQATDD